MKKLLISCFLFVSLFTFSSVDIKYDNFDFYINQNIDNQLNSIEADTVSLIQENSTESKKKVKNKPVEFLGTPIFDAKDFWRFFFKTLFNLLVVLIIVRGLYYPLTRNKDYLFTYLLISLTVFVLCVLLDDVKLSFGFALGLFAIFGIIRYRTDAIPIKEMTYLFVVIGVSVVNALANKKISYLELLFANSIIVFVTYGMEKLWLLKHESKKNIVYEKIELIVPEKENELLEDLKLRTGLSISRFEITKIDFLRDVANICIYYYEKED